MQNYFILYLLITVEAQQLCKSSYNRTKLIFQQTLNESFNKVYNEIIKTATINEYSYVFTFLYRTYETIL
jgi:hypothetical protein